MVEVEYGCLSGSSTPQGFANYEFSLRLRNRGTTAIGIERVSVLAAYGTLLHPDNRWIDSKGINPPRPIDALNGFYYDVVLTSDLLSGEGHEDSYPRPKWLSFTAFLTDGRKVRSKRVSGFTGTEPSDRPFLP